MAPFLSFALNERSGVPLYRQIADRLSSYIENGSVDLGQRLPATRELAGQLGLNRATISAAYALLEETGLIKGHVGRGSFVARRKDSAPEAAGPDWAALFPAASREASSSSSPVHINFASSRPDQVAFPLATFRNVVREVVDSPEAAEILQLGSPYGYKPLRRFLIDKATEQGIARPSDGVLITNGCQQALDLLARAFSAAPASNGYGREGAAPGVVIEDPAYHGLLRVLSRTGLPLFPVPVGKNGMDLDALEETLLRHRPRLLIVTPSFQNPTGVTLPLASRKRILSLVSAFNLVLVENDIYSQLRYSGDSIPSLKQLDTTGNTILLRSFSKVAFPGLRVGWVMAPRAVITRLADEKQSADLHSDQLSQAVLLRFAESGELDRHLRATCEAGTERLRVALAACARFLPTGSQWTRPEGGMSLWVELPVPLKTEQVLRDAQKNGVDFLRGRDFTTHPAHERAFRLCFGGLTSDRIERGLQIIGEAAEAELGFIRERMHAEPAMALV